MSGGGSRKIELTWVCTNCGHRNLGRFKACQSCGNPKDASERFEMPGDTRAAPSVSDPRLFAQAREGADWRCTYCGTDNRASLARCVQCGAERGATPDVKQLARAAPAPLLPRGAPSAGGLGMAKLGAGLVAIVLAATVLGCLGTGVFGWLLARSSSRAPAVHPPAPTSEVLDASVVQREWRALAFVERRRIVEHEGFAEQRPPDAFDVVQDGTRHHHDEQVPDGTTTETYFEDVPYQDVESYTEMVPCGEDCTTIPPTCTEHCTDDGNGFATCNEVCSGGGTTCTPRSCPEVRTRPVTRTRPEMRTRDVPRYRSEPRDAPWLRWRVWEWTRDRSAERTGGADEPGWPDDAELGPGAPLGEGEEERVRHSGSARVQVRDARGREHWIVLPDVEALGRYPVGATLRIEVSTSGTFVREIAPGPAD